MLPAAKPDFGIVKRLLFLVHLLFLVRLLVLVERVHCWICALRAKTTLPKKFFLSITAAAALTTYEAELVPALAHGDLLLGEVDILGAAGAHARHLGLEGRGGARSATGPE